MNSTRNFDNDFSDDSWTKTVYGVTRAVAPTPTTTNYPRNKIVFMSSNSAVRIIWSVTTKYYTYYECHLKRPSGKTLRNIAVFTNLATDDTYNFFGLGL